ncbi:DUF551 domain-containing protein, partial [Yersinia enterocolitica]
VERLEEIRNSFLDCNKETAPSIGEIFALIDIALAAKRAEPVGYLEQNHLDYLRSGSDADIWPEGGAGDIPVYLAPQLNSLEMPDGWKLVPIEPTQNMVDAHISGMQLAGFSRAYRDMLAAAPEPQKQQQNIPEIILQGWIKCSDQMPEVGDVVITAYQGCTNVGQMERSGKTYRYFTSIASGRELPAT